VDDARDPAFLTLFAMPALTAADHGLHGPQFHTNFFNAAAGGDPLCTRTFLDLPPSRGVHPHPAGMGIVRDLPVFSRKPLSVTRSSCSRIAIGFLGWGEWAHHMFASGLGPVAVSAFGLSTMLIAIRPA